jgi:D-beta-D-heptose 7-phosphate kinase/D-beta-D-heptose 1-phosphate adenosyltransferase
MLHSFNKTRLLCVGDLMLDRFVYGVIERISPEAPVPVVHLASTKTMLGGIGNVARNIAALGAEAVLLGITGKDVAASELSQLVVATDNIIDASVSSDTRLTTTKTRVIAGHQQVLRLDDELPSPINPTEEAAVLDAIRQHLQNCQAVILSDYAKGLLTPQVIAFAIAEAKRLRIPVFVDPKRHDFSVYSGATVLTPNLKELRAASRMPVDTDEEVVSAARYLLATAGVQAILATRSEKGMMLIRADGDIVSVPTKAKEVFDVSGAGDTVIATAALCMGQGYSLPEAMNVANTAAGIVVGKLGTATVSYEELRATMELASSEEIESFNKIVDRKRAVALVELWRQQGLVVGFTNGCFDILHSGHVASIREARRNCERLIIGVNADASVSRLKGPHRPINHLHDRTTVLSALEAVDLVVGFDEDTPLELINALRPHVLFKGSDYSRDQVVGADIVEAHGGRVMLIELIPGRSTTAIIDRAQGKTFSLADGQ